MGLTDPGKKNSAEDHARRVRDMFARISPRYDLLNHLLSVNIDRRWRRNVVEKLRPLLSPDAQVLDVACGTGDLSIALFENIGARVTGVDFCRPMLERAAQKQPRIAFVEGDALQLPFDDAVFDAVTIAFGLRNLSSVEQGLGELRDGFEAKRLGSDFGIFEARRAGLSFAGGRLLHALVAANRGNDQRIAQCIRVSS